MSTMAMKLETKNGGKNQKPIGLLPGAPNVEVVL
jgi:hypothetical protein